MKISIAIPSRNNLKYLKFAYQSIRHYVKEKHEIVLLDDASTDGTWEWIKEVEKLDQNVISYRNNGPERVGHVYLYDKAAELCKHETFSIFHADMIATPNYIDNMLKHLSRGVVVCATRIEPELHPSGPEKVTKGFGLEPEEFRMDEFQQFSKQLEIENANSTTNGFFAPWVLYKEDLLKIGGHDKKLFCPMELDDSDLANRLYLTGYKLVQARDSFVGHLTCRGSRFKDGVEIERVIDLPDGSKWYKPKDSQEYLALRNIKFREWWRKFHTDVLHDQYLMPIVHPRYDIGFNIKNCNRNLIELLEPWCDNINVNGFGAGDLYSMNEQKNSAFDISSKFKSELSNDVIVSFDATKFNRQDQFDFIKNLSQILSESGEVGEFEYDIFNVKVNRLIDYRDKLIKNEDFYKWKNIR